MSHIAARVLHRPSFEAGLGDAAFLAAMLAFEVALARAQAGEGVIPESSADAIARAVDHIRLDARALVSAGKRSASLAVPVVETLRAEVQRSAPDAAAHVHFGATSQDVLDTALALCLRRCLDEAEHVLKEAAAALGRRAREHRKSPMLGRTLMQPALPITAGLKIARWSHALARQRSRLAASRDAMAVQLGGPVGDLATMGGRGPAVRARLAKSLELADAIAWHTDRGAWLELGGSMAAVVMAAGKIATDVALLSQAEVGEVREAPEEDGVGGSSAMAHKRNPVACAHALAAATRVPGLLATLHAASLAQHERALGGWQAEPEAMHGLAHALGSALDFVERIGASLVVDAKRMKENLDARPELPAADAVTSAGMEAALDELLEEIDR